MEKPRILVIDDEEIVRISCSRALEGEYEVETASSGQEGLELLEKDGYDLALIDLKMPGMDGMEVLKRMRTQHSGVSVIMMTGYDTIEHVVDSISLGAAHYLEKPFTPDVLVDRIREVLDR